MSPVDGFAIGSVIGLIIVALVMSWRVGGPALLRDTAIILAIAAVVGTLVAGYFGGNGP